MAKYLVLGLTVLGQVLRQGPRQTFDVNNICVNVKVKCKEGHWEICMDKYNFRCKLLKRVIQRDNSGARFGSRQPCPF